MLLADDNPLNGRTNYGTTKVSVEMAVISKHGSNPFLPSIAATPSEVLMFIHQGEENLKRKCHRIRRCMSSVSILGGHSQKLRSHVQKQGLSKSCQSLLDMCYFNQADKLLTSVHKWSFNIFSLENLTNGHSLSFIVQELFQYYKLPSRMGIDVVTLGKFTRLVEHGYHSSNPYHNSTHAADVVQAMHFNMHETKLYGFLKIEEIMAAILAAACHDLDHPGVNQSFLINTSNPLSFLYHNTSVLENHHYRVSKSLLHETGLLSHLDDDTWSTVDNIMMSTILATDISRQQEILSIFNICLDENSLNLVNNPSDRHFVLQIALKCADICNPCRPWHLCYQWSDMICEEFFKQGDCETRLGLQVVPPFDRKKSTLATVQTGFIQFIAEPLFVLWDRFVSSHRSKMLLEGLYNNELMWKDIISNKLQPTFVDIFLKNSLTNSKVAQSENQNNSKNYDLLITKTYDTQQIKQLTLKVSDLCQEESELLESLCTRRRHSIPAVMTSFSTTCSLLTSRQTLISTNIFSCSVSRVFKSTKILEEVINTSKKHLEKEDFLEKLKVSLSTRRASFPMNICIVQGIESDCCHDEECNDNSQKLVLTEFLSSLYIAAISDRSNQDHSVSVKALEVDALPQGVKGVLGFGSQDRMTMLCNYLFHQKRKKVKESCKVINNSKNLSHPVLVLTNQFLTQTLFS